MISSAQMRAARALLGIDQKQLAEMAGVSVPTIQRMESSHGNVRGVVGTLTKIIEALAEIASTSVALNCECPHHIADLLVRLGNFESYSADCESRSPADASLHRYLAQVTGNARAMMEMALVRVIEAEGIAMPKPVA